VKITQPEKTKSTICHQIEELKHIITQISDHSVRPCENCHDVCPSCGSLKCACNCSKECSKIPEKLSSDSVLYPIEDSISPLVYCFNEMNICQTCWSCEGHNDMSGRLEKLPQIWFYTDSFMLLRVLDDCLSLLKAKSLLVVAWQLSTTYTERTCEQSTFALKPDLSFIDHIDLKDLHKDITVLSENFPKMIKKISLDYLNLLNKSLLTVN